MLTRPSLKKISALVAVGALGAALTQTSEAAFQLVDDMENYDLGKIVDVESPWTSHGDPGTNPPGQAGNFQAGDDGQFLGFGFSNNFRTVSRPLPEGAEIAPGNSATFFMQVRVTSDTINQIFLGLTNDPDTSLVNSAREIWGLSGIRAPEAPTHSAAPWNFQVHQDGLGWTTLTQVDPDIWYNVWYVIDYADQFSQPTYQIYLNTGTSDATEADQMTGGGTDTFMFRASSRSAGSIINHIIANGGATKPSNSAHLDNIWIDLSGENLTNPAGAPADFPADLRLTDIRHEEGEFRFSLETEADTTYIVEHTDDLSSGSWAQAGTIAGDGTVQTFGAAVGTEAKGFYRVRVGSE